jgi:hypothetical protein
MAFRQAVRAPLMRATVHLTSARDDQILWPLIGDVSLPTGNYTGAGIALFARTSDTISSVVSTLA